MSDINPDYYRKGGVETYDFIKAKELGFEAGNIVKYVVRYKDKGGLVDLRKAAWYLERLIVEAMIAEGEFAEPDAEPDDELVFVDDWTSMNDHVQEAEAEEEARQERERQNREELLASLARHHAGDCKCRPDGRTQRIACPIHHLNRRPGGPSYASLAAGVDQAGVHEGWGG